MPYPEEASIAEMVSYTAQALWSCGYMKTAFSGSVKQVCRLPATTVLGHAYNTLDLD